MAKQSIANPVVSLGLDSSGLRTGIASSMGDVKSAGSKIGTALKNSISPSTIFSGFGKSFRNLGTALVSSTQYQWEKTESGKEEKKTKAGILTEINSGLSLANKVKNILAAPVNALMDREQFQAERSGLPMLLGSDAGYTGVFARLSQTWEDTLADMMVALDRAFDFRGWIEYARGALASVSAIMEAILGPLKEVNKNPEHLEEMFRLGGEMLIGAFESGAEIMAASYNGFLDVFQSGSNIFTDVFNAFVDLVNKVRELIPSFAKLVASIYSFNPTVWFTKLGAQAGQDLMKGLGLVVRNGQVVQPEGPLGKMARIVISAEKLPPEWAAVLGGTARALFAGMNFAPDKLKAKEAENAANKFIPLMEKMQTARLGSSITSDSTAIVEAVTRASVAGPGQDLQQRVAAAAEETVRQQKATNALQEKILAAYNAAGGDARFKIFAAP